LTQHTHYIVLVKELSVNSFYNTYKIRVISLTLTAQVAGWKVEVILDYQYHFEELHGIARKKDRGTINLQVTEDLFKELVGSQGLPLEGGNICGNTKMSVTTEGGKQRW